MPNGKSPAPKSASRVFRSVKSLPPPKRTPRSAPATRRSIPAGSRVKAAKVFKHFSLSKYAGNATPPNHVVTAQSVVSTQRRIISRQITKLGNSTSSVRGMTIALPTASLKQLLPSFNQKTNTVDLNDVIHLIQQNVRGTEFYARGNPTLNRLAVESQLQQILADVTKSARK
jgi:hypothetical protein